MNHNQENILVQLDLNNPVFQRNLFNLCKQDQLNILRTLRRISKMTWHQVYMGLSGRLYTRNPGQEVIGFTVFESVKAFEL